MGIVQIAPVSRAESKLLISLFGLSETGKTYSALKLAAGIEPNPEKRGLLDTEGGRRGAFYQDAIDGGYLYGALTPPFSPERYLEALRDFIEAGVTTLVVDSVSHAWNAAGGILDMVEQATERNDMAKWAKPKRRLGKLTGGWLQSGLHLILCSRGKQPLVEVVDNGKKTLVPGPVVPIQEKSLRFDMTIMALMLGDGRFTIEKDYGGKCPGALRPIFASGEKMDEKMGAALVAWLGGQDAISPAQRVWALDAKAAAELGTAKFREYWKTLPDDGRAFLRSELPNLQSVAAAADAEAERIRLAEAEDAAREDLSEPFAGAALKNGVERAGVGH